MKKKFLYFLILFSLSSNAIYAQNMVEFYKLYSQANDLTSNGDYKNAEKKYKEALKICRKDTYFYVNLISLKLGLKKDREAKKMLKEGVLKGTSLQQMSHDSLISKKFKSDTTWNMIYEVYRQRYNSSIPFQEEKLKLIVLLEKDQAVRNLMQYFRAGKRDSLVHVQDLEDSKKMYDIVNKIGFPDRDKVGEDATAAMYILLLHLLNDGIKDKEELVYFEPMMKVSVLKGAFVPFWMAILVDRSRVISGLKQKYGSYWEMDATGKRIITPIENIKEVDRRREEIGLPKLVSSKKDGLTLPMDYKN